MKKIIFILLLILTLSSCSFGFNNNSSGGGGEIVEPDDTYYSVSFYIDEEMTDLVQYIKVKSGDKISAPKVAKEGYNFSYWHCDSKGAWDFSNDVVYEDLKIYACWQAKTYKIFYHCENEIIEEEYLYNELASINRHLYKVGYEHIGWSFENGEMLEEEFIYNFTEDIHIYPVFKVIEGHEYSNEEFKFIINDGTVTINEYIGNKKDVVVPDKIEDYPVTRIYFGAFKDCDFIESIKLPESVTNIGLNAFDGCINLKKINIPTNLEYYGSDATIKCENLEYLVEGGARYLTDSNNNPMVLIGIEENIEKLIIQDSVKFISLSSANDKLKSAYIPKSIIGINRVPFNSKNMEIYCESIIEAADWKNSLYANNQFISVYWNVNKNDLKDVDGIQYLKVDNEVYVTNINDESLEEVNIKSTIEFDKEYNVTHIVDRLFNNFKNIKSIFIPDTVNYIGTNSIGNSVEKLTIPFIGQTIDDKENASIGYLYDNNLSISSNICQLKEIIITKDDNIEDNAFKRCEELKKVFIPNTVKSIGNNVFYGCYKLKEIIFEENSTCESIGESVFTSGHLSLIHLPESVLTISKNAIHDLSNLVVYCDAEKKLDDWDEQWCPSDIPVYYDMDEKKFITVDESDYILKNDKLNLIKYHGDKAHYIVEETVKVDDKEYVISNISSRAFAGCSNLMEVSFSNYSGSLSANIFERYSKINVYVDLADIPTSWDSEWNATIFGKVYFDSDNKICVTDDATYYIDGNSATLIKYYGDEYNYVVPNTVKHNKIDYTITKIEEYAFYSRDMKSIYIPKTVEEVVGIIFGDNSDNLKFYLEGEKVEGDLYGSVIYNNVSNVYVINNIEYILTNEGLILANVLSDESEIEIPNSITVDEVSYDVNKIGKEAFIGLTNLNSLTLNKNNNDLSKNVFYGCLNLKTLYYNGNIKDWVNINFNDEYSNPMYYAKEFKYLDNEEYVDLIDLNIDFDVDKIKDYQFYSFDNLKTINISGTVSEIGKCAFYGCSSLESLILDDSIEYIGDSSFYSCYKLSSVVLSEGLRKLGTNVFKNCSKIVYNVLEEAKYLGSEENQYLLLCDVPSGALEFEINSDCALIYETAFEDCSKLTSVTMHENLIFIGREAFKNTKELVDVNYSGSIADWCNINLYSIASNPMFNAELFNISIGNVYKELEEIVIPKEVTEIGNWQFANFKSTSLSIAGSVEKIGEQAFYNNELLEEITFDQSSVLKTIGKEAFANNKLIESLFIPSSVEEIGSHAINNMDGLKSLSIPFIGTSLDKVSKVNVIFEKYPENLTEIHITGNTKIAAFTFYNNDIIQKIGLSSNISSIGQEAFSSCDNLSELSLEGFNNETKIALDVFKDTNIDVIYYDGSMDEWCNIVFENEYSTPVNTETSFLIKDSSDNYSEIKKIELSNDITNISDYQFNNMSSVEEVIIPNSVTSYAKYILEGCTNIKTLSIPFLGESNEYANGSQLAVLFGGNNTEYYVPQTLETVSITNATYLAEFAFNECRNIKNIYLNEGIESFGRYCFRNCSSLIELEIKEGLISIDAAAFENCTSLTNLIIPSSIEEISHSVFDNTPNLNFNVIDNCNYLGNALNEYVVLVNVIDIEGVQTRINSNTRIINQNAFNGCYLLNAISIPESVVNIGMDAFANCSRLTIYCEALEQPSGWSLLWNPDDRPVVWGHQKSE